MTLTNNSIYPMTMAAPAVTFSDPGFNINPSTDYCSNVVLQPSASCPLNIVFAPVPSDAPMNPATIYASMIAAGTENASISVSSATSPTTQDVLVVAEALVSGLAAPNPADLQGATLLDNQSPPSPSYTFPSATVDPQTETYTFTSDYSVGVKLQNGPQGIPVVLSNMTDYSILGNTCTTGLTLFAGGARAVSRCGI